MFLEWTIEARDRAVLQLWLINVVVRATLISGEGRGRRYRRWQAVLETKEGTPLAFDARWFDKPDQAKARAYELARQQLRLTLERVDIARDRNP